MRLTRLTEVSVRALRPPPKGQKTYWGDPPGFGVRVSQGGTKSFVLMTGRERNLVTIGRYPIISLAEARGEAKRLLAERTLGKTRAPRISYGGAVALFLSTHCEQNNRPRTIAETKRLLSKFPFGNRALSEIAPEEISRVIDKLLPTPSTANHAFTAIRTFFKWAQRRRYVAHSPCEGMQLPTRPVTRDRVLSEQELVTVFKAAEETGWPFGTIVRLLILTGLRRNEVSALRWEHIDQDERTITIPAALSKNKRANTVPYGHMTASILQAIPTADGFLFPARGSDTSFNGWSKAKAKLNRTCQIAPWTLHDLRRTFTTLNAAHTAPHVLERLLGHSSGQISGVAAVYNRYRYMDEMREAVARYEGRLAELLNLD